MDTFIYFLIIISYIILFFITSYFSKGQPFIHYDNVLLLVILALLYDNGMLAIGKYIGEGDLLKNLNEFRYWLHGFITPLLILFAWNTLRKADITFSKKATSNLVINIITLIIIFIELFTLLDHSGLEPKWTHGILSYEMTKPFDIPIMIFAVMFSLLITSIIVWWKQKWPWYFIGVIAMALAPLLERFLETGTAHNISELILMFFLVATKRFQDKLIE